MFKLLKKASNFADMTMASRIWYRMGFSEETMIELKEETERKDTIRKVAQSGVPREIRSALIAMKSVFGQCKLQCERYHSIGTEITIGNQDVNTIVKSTIALVERECTYAQQRSVCRYISEDHYDGSGVFSSFATKFPLYFQEIEALWDLYLDDGK